MLRSYEVYYIYPRVFDKYRNKMIFLASMMLKFENMIEEKLQI